MVAFSLLVISLLPFIDALLPISNRFTRFPGRGRLLSAPTETEVEIKVIILKPDRAHN